MSVPNKCLSQTDFCPKQMSVPNKFLSSIQLYIEETRKCVCPKQFFAPEGRAGGAVGAQSASFLNMKKMKSVKNQKGLSYFNIIIEKVSADRN